MYQPVPSYSPVASARFLFVIAVAVVLLVGGCSDSESPEKSPPEHRGNSSGSLEDHLAGKWSLDRVGTISATKAAAERAGKGHSAADAALREYLESEATPEEAARIKEALADGMSAEEAFSLLRALNVTDSPEEAIERMTIPVEHLDLALDVVFDHGEFRTSESSKAWRYSVSDEEESSVRGIVELTKSDDTWTMGIELNGKILMIEADEELHLRLGARPEEIARLPSPMVFVFKRSTDIPNEPSQR